MAPTRVLVADAHPASRAGTRSVLEEDSFQVCAEADDAASAVEAAVRERPAICLLDAQMPGGGITAAAEIARRVPDTRIVLLTSTSGDGGELLDAVRAGARGLMPKDTNPGRLAFALRGVLNGEAALPRSLVPLLLTEVREREPGRHKVVSADGREAELTPREWDVLELLRHELATDEIADRLGISAVTVRTHVSALLRKLSVADRAALRRLMEGRAEAR